MSEAELARFLGEERVVTCASIGPNGRPHLMPLWYVVDDGVVTAWTYAKSQKVRNLERKPQATLQVEAGDVDRKSTRLNSSHRTISYAVFCLKKKKKKKKTKKRQKIQTETTRSHPKARVH